MISLASLTTEEVLVDDEQVLMEYHSKVISLWMDLYRIRKNLYLLEKIKQLPIRLVVIDDPNDLFWQAFIHNALDINILIMCRLVTNTGGNTLLKFRNYLRQQVKPEYRPTYQERLRASSVEQPSLSKLIERMTERRNGQIAHSDLVFRAGDITDELLEDQKMIYEAVERAFQAVVFRDVPVQAIWELEEINIEPLLLCAAQDSRVIHAPEGDPELWNHYRLHAQQELINKVNRYRSKLGLPFAPPAPLWKRRLADKESYLYSRSLGAGRRLLRIPQHRKGWAGRTPRESQLAIKRAVIRRNR